ncbi:MAG: LamG domain-containing protein [Lentisphaerae bacterium]|nr:LamG domain-containing protein [Lentisphaerota bacterium]
MKTQFLGAVMLLPLLWCAAEVPQHSYDFEKKNSSSMFIDNGIGKPNAPLYGNLMPVDNGNGARCVDNFLPSGFIQMDYPQYTIEFRFRMDKEFVRGKSRGLFNYEFWSWNRRCFRLRINPEGCLELYASVHDGDNQKPKLRYILASKPVKWQTSVWYTVRLTGEKGKNANIYLDGKMIAAGSGAPGMNDINDGVKHELDYVVRLGYDTSDPRIPHGLLNGAIDDLKIWNRAIPPQTEKAAYASTVRQDIIAVTENIPSQTNRFDVPDKDGEALGTKLRQDRKFLDAAATASIVRKGDNFIVTFHCPIPAGMEKQLGDESVEFFLRPDIGSPKYYQYYVYQNKLRAFRYHRRMVADKNFKSGSTLKIDRKPGATFYTITIPVAEVECEKLPAGSIVTVNFCRSGAAAGGLTSWIPMAGDFHSVDSFGKMIIGSYQEALEKETGAIAAEAARHPGNETLKKELLDRIAKQHAANRNCGNDFVRFKQLSVDNENLRKMLLSYVLSGKPVLLWQGNSWGNRFEPDLLSEPVKKIRLTMAQNSRVMTGMVLSNLTGRPYGGMIKCFNSWPLVSGTKTFWKEPYNDFLRGIKFYEGMMIQDVGGNPLYDPMLELPMRSIIRLAPNSSAPLWMTISSKGLTPGIYRAKIVVKPFLTGFSTEVADLEVEVLPIDLGKIKLDSFHYAFFTEHHGDDTEYTNRKELFRYLVEKEANIMFAGHLTTVYPDMNEDGSCKEIDFSVLDGKIEEYIAAGMPQKDLKLMFNLHYFIMMTRNAKDKYSYIRPRHEYGTPKWEKGFKEFMTKFYAHMKERFGFDPDRVIIYTGDEPEGDINDPKSKLHRVMYIGRLVREAVPNASTVTNPYPRGGVTKKFLDDMDQLCRYHNIIILGVHGKEQKLIDYLNNKGIKVWTYGIYNKNVAPEVYRRMYLQSFLEGCGAPQPYWAIDSYAGDGFDSTDFAGDYLGGYTSSRIDWGSAYVEANLGAVTTSRRAEAHYQGLLDYKAFTLCRELIRQKGNAPADIKRLNNIISKAMSNSCDGMDDSHLEVLKFIMELQSRK